MIPWHGNSLAWWTIRGGVAFVDVDVVGLVFVFPLTFFLALAFFIKL